jgi:CBS domain-containing protein
VLDEIANMAFWIGLMKAMPDDYKSIWKRMDFEDSKENFFKAARFGIQTGMNWERSILSVKKLILDILLPLAKKGLQQCHIDPADITRYLDVIEERTQREKTGSRWMVNGFRTLKKELGRDEAMVTLTAAIHKRRVTGEPVHLWPDISLEEKDLLEINYDLVTNIMTTDLITAQSNDPIELVYTIMDWRTIRHMPVEDDTGNVIGILTRKRIENYLNSPEADPLATADNIMIKDPVCIDFTAGIMEAMNLMVEKNISCLPVIQKGQLIGLITDTDLKIIQTKLNSRLP